MKAIIADDEPLLALSLRTALAEAWPELDVAAVVPNGIEAVQAAERLRPEVAFLDIQMPGMTGLEAAEEIVERMGEAAPAIVFVTAYDEFALKAFDLAAVDYVLKPVAPARLAQTVARLKGRRTEPDLAAQLRLLLAVPRAEQTLAHVRAGTGNTVRMIPLEEVCYFQSSDKYTSVVTPDAEVLLRMPLKELIGQLPAGRFQQIHRGTVVNLAEVAAAVRDETGRVVLRLRRRKEALPVSRVYSDLFKAM
ncbi:MAG TPA: LytTR family DNA-binding domain-containing protein [Burkholderiales bacterium]|jgi:DNA-binding LytR/AlgR family response regulator|nr:LytTR family DNA-binding domain-containing protein [Burkholderiales bacterium]